LNAEKERISIEEFEKLGAGSLRAAVKDGDEEKGSFMAGQIAGMVSKEQTAGQMIEEMMTTTKQLMTNIEKIRGVDFE
ncbi:MAG: enoyl-[acyl-carrier-protein] reductase FabK, partial [Oscillospiraceae bacterium]